MFSHELLDKIKSATNLITLAEEYGAKFTSAGVNVWQSKCPHPDHEDSTPSFRIRHNKNNSWTWCCMGCHCGSKNSDQHLYGTDCFAFLQWITDYEKSPHKMSFTEAVKILAKRAGITLESEKYSYELRQNYLRAMAYQHSIPTKVTQYLNNRGLDKNDIIEWKIGFSCFPESCARWSCVPRITFPLWTRYNQVLGFSARKFNNDNDLIPKYRNSPNSQWFHKGNYFYGIHKLDDSLEYVIITEGVVDVILAYKYGLKNVLAPLGTSFTEEHASLLRAKNMTPIFCMDGDNAGVNAVKKAVAKMSALGIYSKVMLLPNGMDLADAANEFKNNLPLYFDKHTVCYWQYSLKNVTTDFENRLQSMRMEILPAIKKAVKGLNTDDERIMLKSYVKERFGIDVTL